MLPDHAHKAMNEQYKGRLEKPIYTVMLPCNHVRIEIMRPEDQVLVCPQCRRKSYFIYSRIGKSKWGYTS